MNDTIEARIEGLLKRMTIDQKVGQIVQAESKFASPADAFDYHLGSIFNEGGSLPGENRPEDYLGVCDGYWDASMKADDGHLAIPILYAIDAIHGHNNVRGAVVFPHNIGLGATHDPDLMERIARTTAREIAATGLDWTYAPTVAVARNDHWGRTYESYSESPDLVCTYAPRFVRGLQGDLSEAHVIACVKHWVGDGATEHGIDRGDTCIDEAELRRLHIPPYRNAIDAGALTIMVSLSSWNQLRCHGHRYLVTTLLKDELAFDGIVLSDWNAIDPLSEDYGEAVAIGLNAGLDMFMITDKWKAFIHHARDHVATGRVSMERLDDAVRRVLRVKARFGLFEKPRPSRRRLAGDPAAFGTPEHRDVAREAVRKSLVLLKNEAGALPLDKQARILVAGKNAHNRGHQCGGFTIAWQGVNGNDAIAGGTSIWEGIRAVAPNAVLSADLSGIEADPVVHDAAVVVIGELPYAEVMGDLRVDGLPRGRRIKAHSHGQVGAAHSEAGDNSTDLAWSANPTIPIMEAGPYGTHLDLERLHPEDLAVMETIAARGIPIVAVLVSGRPLVVNRELERAHAFVAAWLPGSEGQGVADVLFGDHDFHGKLTFSWPRKDDDNWNLGDPGYDPLFPVGYGLTYQKT